MAARHEKIPARWALVQGWAMAGWNMLRMPGRSHRGPLPPPDAELEELAIELRRHVVCLAAEIGERNVQRRPQQLAQAAEYIQAEFSRGGYPVKRQWYEVLDVPCANLEAEVPGGARAEEIVVVGAHYDSVPSCPAANDNGSGVAAMLALARRFAQATPQRTVRFVAFVNEEAPYGHTELMGSRVYARRCRARGEKIAAMMSLETIGYYSDDPGSQKYPPLIGRLYPSTGDFIGFIGNARSGPLVRQAVAAFRRREPFPSQGGVLPEAIPNIGFSDHWSFWQEGYPALMVTDTAPFRYPHYHTPEDTPDKIDFDRLARVTRGLQAVAAALANE